MAFWDGSPHHQLGIPGVCCLVTEVICCWQGPRFYVSFKNATCVSPINCRETHTSVSFYFGSLRPL